MPTLIRFLLGFAAVAGLTGLLRADEPQQNLDARQRPQSLPTREVVEERKSREAARLKGDLTFDDIKFDMEKGDKFERKMITQDIESLNKRTVRIRGYILPASVFKQKGIEQFVLVRDNMECCFGPGAALYDCIMVQMEKGKSTDFTTRQVTIKGKFEIKEFKYPGSEEHYAIYEMIATEAR